MSEAQTQIDVLTERVKKLEELIDEQQVWR